MMMFSHSEAVNCTQQSCTEGNATRIPCMCEDMMQNTQMRGDFRDSRGARSLVCETAFITWYTETQMIGECKPGAGGEINDEFKDIMTIDPTDETLMIFNATSDNRGVYRCERYDGGPVSSYWTELVVWGECNNDLDKYS